MKLDKIIEEIQKDVLDENVVELDKVSLQIPKLHSKWKFILVNERQRYNQIESEYHQLYKLKWEYYTGKLSQQELDTLGWEPFHLRILRTDIDIYLKSDSDLIKKKSLLELQTVKIDLIDSFIKEIMQRQWTVKNAVEWRKFMSGE